MPLKKFKSLTPSTRSRVLLDKRGFNVNSFKFLRLSLVSFSGRNLSGKITVRHKGGRVFSFYKVVDLKRLFTLPGVIVDFSFDKCRTALVGLVLHDLTKFNYLLIPNLISKDKLITTKFNFVSLKENLGDSFPIGWLPISTIVFNIENRPGYGGTFARAAGSFCKILRHSHSFVEVSLPSGLKKKVSLFSMATVGRSSNINHRFERFSSAGYFRRLGRRPSVRGQAMNAVDHPNGGRTRGGKPSMSPWGKIVK